MKVSEIIVGDWASYRNPFDGEFTPIKIENIYGNRYNCEVDCDEIIEWLL